MNDTDLAPGLWTPDEICDIYRRLLQWCADHPDESTPRLEQMYRDRFTKYATLAREERAARAAQARLHPVVDDILTTWIADTQAVYGVTVKR